MEIFVELTGIVLIATLSAILMRFLKQPLIVGYILAGILSGPYFFNFIQSRDHIELFSKIGITILLFIVGLSLSPKVIKEVGKASLITGLGQIIVTSIIGFCIASFLGIEKIAALYVAIALTFSSTIIVLKLLSDRGDLNKLYGKIAIGFLLVQDIVATMILLITSALAGPTDQNIATILGWLLIKSAIILTVLYIVSGYIMPRVSRFMASSQELLFLFSLSWGLGLASLFYLLGFSVEIGALIAGVTLSLTPFSYEIGARLKPLRDFFIVLFFILLGSKMVLGGILSLILPAVILSLYVLIGNPIIMIVLMNLIGYKRRTGFMAGLTVAQISEFSLIIATLGFSVGHLSQEVLSLITLVGLITIAGSTYFILYSEKIYLSIERYLKFLELRKESKRKGLGNEEDFEIILFGYNKVGLDFLKAFNKLEKKFLVVDFDPASIKILENTSVPHRFGDAQDVEFISQLNLSKVKMCVSTIPDYKVNILLVSKIRDESSHAIVIVLSYDLQEAEELYNAGASYVIMPDYIGARHASGMIARFGMDRDAFKEERVRHLEHLSRRKREAEDSAEKLNKEAVPDK